MLFSDIPQSNNTKLAMASQDSKSPSEVDNNTDWQSAVDTTQSPPDSSTAFQSPPPVTPGLQSSSSTNNSHTIPFLLYAYNRFKSNTGSIFLDGLVGGMFLTFLMDTEDNCDERTFTIIFFIIGILHFISSIVQNLSEYAEAAAALDGVISPVENIISWCSWLVLQTLRLVQLPMVLVLGYYGILKFSIIESGKWTHDRMMVEKEEDEACTVCFCEGNYVHLAQITFAFQIIFGLVQLLLWWVMWYVDREDDKGEKIEELQWKREEEMMANTWKGKVMELMALIAMHSFYNDSV